MKTEDIDGYKPSKWIPITDLQTLAALGKLQEELGELTSIIGRCIIQGIDERDPETNELNRDNLQKEIADVMGMSVLVMDRLGLDKDEIDVRASKKLKMKHDWLEMLR